MNKLNIVCGHFGELEFEKYGELLSKGKDLFEIVGEDTDGYYIESNVSGYPKDMFLLHNPIADNYWLCYEDKIPVGYVDFMNKTVLCHKLKYNSLILPKNACSSLVETALIYDKVMKKPLSEGEKIWDHKDLTPKRVHPTISLKDDKKYRKDYKTFAVVSDPYSRFLRFINHNQSKRYCNKFKPVGENWSKEQSINEYLWALPYITKSVSVWDDHAVLQSRLILNAEKYNKGNYELVKLEDLDGWFKDTFKVSLYRNNVSSKDSKIFKLEDFNESQMNILNDYLKPDVDFFNRKNITFKK